MTKFASNRHFCDIIKIDRLSLFIHNHSTPKFDRYTRTRNWKTLFLGWCRSPQLNIDPYVQVSEISVARSRMEFFPEADRRSMMTYR